MTINREHFLNKIKQDVQLDDLVVEQVLDSFISILQEIKEEEKSHILVSLNENNDIRSAFICNEALAAYESLSLMILE